MCGKLVSCVAFVLLLALVGTASAEVVDGERVWNDKTQICEMGGLEITATGHAIFNGRVDHDGCDVTIATGGILETNDTYKLPDNAGPSNVYVGGTWNAYDIESFGQERESMIYVNANGVINVATGYGDDDTEGRYNPLHWLEEGSLLVDPSLDPGSWSIQIEDLGDGAARITAKALAVKVEFDSGASGDLESVSPAVLNVSLSEAGAETITVDYATVGCTAIAGLDYILAGACQCDFDGSGQVDFSDVGTLAEDWLSQAPGLPAEVSGDDVVDNSDFAVCASQWLNSCGSSTLTFNPGQTSRAISIDIVEDSIDEDDETIVVELSNPATTGSDEVQLGDITQHTYTIEDPRPGVGFESAQSRGNETEGTAAVSVVLSRAYTETVTVDYAVTGGTATGGGVDYTLAPGTLSFAPGVAEQDIDITLMDDEIEEFPYETIEIALSNQVNAKLTQKTHTLTIVDDEMQAAFTNGLGMKFLLVQPDDTFTMGRNVSVGETYSYEGPSHQVTMDRPFFIMEQSVSNSTYQQSGLGGSADDVSWDNANAFAQWLSNSAHGDGFTYRLPSEAEWEYIYENPDAPLAGTVQGIGSGKEWTNDWLAPFGGNNRSNPMGPAAGIMKVVRSNGTTREALAQNARSKHGYGSIKFRLVAEVEATTNADYDAAPFNHAAVKQSTGVAQQGPNPNNPYFHVRLAQSIPPDTDINRDGALVGLDGAVWSHNHSPGLTALPNGDVIACWFSGKTRQGNHEKESDTRFIWARLRYGSDIWELPELFYDMRMNDQSAALWTDSDGTVWSINGGHGNDNVLFKLATSQDKGATWRSWFPESADLRGDYTAQPIPSVFRDNSGNLYFAMDGSGDDSFLWKSTDNGLNWVDQGGRTSTRHSTIVAISNPVGALSISGKEDNRADFSSNWGGGWSNWSHQHGWFKLGSNQRPDSYRMANGHIVYAQDSADARHGESGPNPFVAISTDDGQSWHTKRLPVARRHQMYMHDNDAAGTLAYASVTQSPNGLIHVMSTMTAPGLDYEFNEAWVFSGSGDMVPERTGGTVQSYSENYPGGSLRATWSARTTPGGRYLLDGPETTYYPDGSLEYEAVYESGVRVTASYYAPNGPKVWTWNYNNANNTAVWTKYWANGYTKLESGWKSFPQIATTSGSRGFRGLLAHGDAVHYNRSGSETARYNFNFGCRGAAWSCIDQTD